MTQENRKKNRTRAPSHGSRSSVNMGRPGGDGGEPPSIESSLPDVGMPLPSPKCDLSPKGMSSVVHDLSEDGNIRSRSTPTSSSRAHKQPTWGVKLRPLKEVPTIPHDETLSEERRNSLVRQSTLASLEQKEVPMDRVEKGGIIASLPTSQAPLRPIENQGGLAQPDLIAPSLHSKRLPKLNTDDTPKEG